MAANPDFRDLFAALCDQRADFIVVMEDGRIVQRGTHAELMRVPGPYLHVAQLQIVDGRELEQLKLKEAAG